MLASLDTVIRALHLISAAIWAGGLVFLAVAVGVARRVFPDSPERIEFFRKMGWTFFAVGGVALLVLIATGSKMVSDGFATWGDRILREKVTLVGVVIVLTLVHSLIQSPPLSRLRQRALERPDDAELAALIRRKSILAGIVDSVIMVATLGILVLAARLVTG